MELCLTYETEHGLVPIDHIVRMVITLRVGQEWVCVYVRGGGGGKILGRSG